MKQKNILFTDMDGTILFSDNGKTYFKESDLDAIKEFQQRGNLIVINSGRALPWIVAPLEGYLLPDYMIAGTGSIIADSHQQILHEEPVSFTAIKKIINEYESDIPLTVHTKDNVFSCNQKKQYNLPTTPISSIDLLKTEKLYGMSFHFKDNKSAKAFADWLEKSDHQEVRAFVNIQDVDMACRDCSKGNAINILCQKLGFMHEQIYAIGDAENDIDMLRATKHGCEAHRYKTTNSSPFSNIILFGAIYFNDSFFLLSSKRYNSNIKIVSFSIFIHNFLLLAGNHGTDSSWWNTACFIAKSFDMVIKSTDSDLVLHAPVLVREPA